MRKISINPKALADGDIGSIAASFKKGEVVVYPTDTIYGLGSLATSKKAIARIFKIKKRSQVKALLVLVASFRMLKGYFFVSRKEERYLKKIWPGPISVLLKRRTSLPADLAPGKERVAVRLPKSDFLIKMIRRVGAPIVSTSLNISGEKILTSVVGLEKYFKKFGPDLVVDGGANFSGRPSRLIDISDPDKIIILRK